jgi:hypothetical protein
MGAGRHGNKWRKHPGSRLRVGNVLWRCTTTRLTAAKQVGCVAHRNVRSVSYESSRNNVVSQKRLGQQAVSGRRDWRRIARRISQKAS